VHVARKGDTRNVYNSLVGTSEGKRPLGRHRRRWETNIRMYIREIGWEGVDWMRLVQDGSQERARVHLGCDAVQCCGRISNISDDPKDGGNMDL
jgi:hypothetical protein